MLRRCFTIFALLLTPAAFANAAPDDKCTDDNGLDRCDLAVQAKVRDVYGLTDISALAEQGAYVRRAMMVDGYGRDVLAVSFVRQKGMDPFVEIRGPRQKGAKMPRSVSMPIALSEWNNVTAKGSYFDRDLASKRAPNGAPAPLSICLHSWVVTVEAADPTRLSSNTLPAANVPREIRTKTQSACDGGLAIQYAFQLADMAYDLIPVCRSVDPEMQRNKAMALNACLGLSGDRAAAGQALSLSHDIRRALNIYPKDAAQTRQALLRLMVSAAPNDRPDPNSGQMTQSAREALVSVLQQGDIYFNGHHGVDADHVEIDAMQVQRMAGQMSADNPQRTIKIYASREVGEFRIYRIDTLAFTPAPKQTATMGQ